MVNYGQTILAVRLEFGVCVNVAICADVCMGILATFPLAPSVVDIKNWKP